ncbi:MAG: hypothetical protein QXH32_05545 [Candidatus Caldarchaeum sp.]
MSKATTNPEELTGEKIYDYAVEAGTTLSGADKTTISQLIEVFQSEPNAVDACHLIILHIVRQSARGEIPRHGASILVKHLNQFYQSFKTDSEKLAQTVLKYLTLVKWVRESGPRGPLNTFQKFVESIR